jgi:hypothetical protein
LHKRGTHEPNDEEIVGAEAAGGEGEKDDCHEGSTEEPLGVSRQGATAGDAARRLQPQA